jgi:membrane-associated phospholipid phosphatase
MTGAEQVNRVEGAVLRRVTALPRGAPRRWVITLSTAARGNVLWALICAVLAVRSGAGRQAAICGVTALVGASAASHLLGQVLTHRPRPRVGDLPARRALPEQPSSSSFPSAHATSAAALTTALLLENRVLGALVAPVAAVVTYSRVRTRVHWPTDVLAGAALGVLIALGTRRLPAVSPGCDRGPRRRRRHV